MNKYSWGTTSLQRLSDVDPGLIKVVTRGLEFMDLTVQYGGGLRDSEAQKRLFAEGKSTKDGITSFSRHQGADHPDCRNGNSDAVDIAPWPILWDDPRRWYYMGGLILGLGKEMNIPMIWGGDWDSDGKINDQEFHDLGHFERIQ